MTVKSGRGFDTLTVHLDPRSRQQIEEIAKARELSTDDVLREAVSSYLDYEAWAKAEIESGMREADAGDFATAEEVEAAFRRLRS